MKAYSIQQCYLMGLSTDGVAMVSLPLHLLRFFPTSVSSNEKLANKCLNVLELQSLLQSGY